MSLKEMEYTKPLEQRVHKFAKSEEYQDADGSPDVQALAFATGLHVRTVKWLLANPPKSPKQMFQSANGRDPDDIRSQVRAELEAEARIKVRAEAAKQAKEEIREEVTDSVRAEMISEFKDTLRLEIEAKVRAELLAEVEAQAREELAPVIEAEVREEMGQPKSDGPASARRSKQK